MSRNLLVSLLFILAAPLQALGFTFDNIDGGTHDLREFRGQPVLVVNTASLCGFTDQYAGLQELYDRYKARGLVVLAVPSDDFRQELSSNHDVKEFCALNFALTLPMTTITSVAGSTAHPFYKWLRANHGFVPRWNFNKVLLSPGGGVAEIFGSNTKPLSRKLTRAIEAQLPAR